MLLPKASFFIALSTWIWISSLLSAEGAADTKYRMTGTFSFVCQDDHGSYYEPYGRFAMDIGSYTPNQNYQVWKAEADTVEVPNGDWYLVDINYSFTESSTFMDTGASLVSLHGKVMEWDGNASPPDLIGIMEGTQRYANDFLDPQTMKFYGADGSLVKVILQIQPFEARKRADL